MISESDIIYEQPYKPGGTLTAVIGKWQSRISERRTDESGLTFSEFEKILGKGPLGT
jgi:hypothetical protein